MDQAVFEKFEKLVNQWLKERKIDFDDFQQRLSNLEAAQTSADGKPTPTCNATPPVAEQIDAMGRAYNEIEEVVHSLEVANRDKGKRLSKVEQVIKEIKEDHARAQSAVQSVETANAQVQTADPHTDFPSIHHDLAKQKSALDSMSGRIGKLESGAPYSTSVPSTHEVAQDLLRRLGNGDKLNSTLHLALQASLSGIPGNLQRRSPLTPAITDISRRASTATGTSDEGVPAKRGRGRPRKHKLSDSVDGEPQPKHMRGRQPKDGLSEPIEDATRPERPSSQKHGRYPLRSSVDASFSSESETSEMSIQPNSTTSMNSLSRAATSESAATRTSGGEEVLEGLTFLPGEGFVLKDSDNDKRQSRKMDTSGLTMPSTDGTYDEENSEPAVKQYAAITPKSRSVVTPKPKTKSHGDTQKLDMSSPEHTVTPNTRRIKAAYSTPLNADNEDAEDEDMVIPPERRSRRTPKRPTPFGNVVSWKEANLQMQGMKPRGSRSE